MSERKTLYLTEGLWITASIKGGSPSFSAGGGGPGYGGWGLSEGRPRGTGKLTSNIGQELAWQKIMGAEQQGSDKMYAAQYSPAMAQLPKLLLAERTALEQQAIAEGGSAFDVAERKQQLLTSQLQQRRSAYLQLLPQATGFYGAISFYKRFDSFFTRINDSEVFPMVGTGETWSNNIYKTYDDSLDASYKLHLEAEKLRNLASALPDFARQMDSTELALQPVDLLKVAARRTHQIQLEQQICFDCLPNFIQHELVEAALTSTDQSLAEVLKAYLHNSNTMIQAKQAQIPAYTAINPAISGPLSKPQVEALEHLVDEQAKRRAGRLWADYHRALSISESVRHLQWFSSALTNLHERAAEVEHLQARQHAEFMAQEADRQQNEAQRNRIRYASAANAPAITPIGAASFAIPDMAYAALRESVRAAMKAAIERVLASSPSVLVGTLALLWPSSLGNSERRYLTSIRLTDISPPDGPDLGSMAASAQALDLPYLLAGVEEADRLDLYIVPGGKSIPVREAVFDAERQVFSLALDNPQRILTWTPAIAPGSQDGSSTSLPTVSPGTVIYGGSSLDPVNNESQGYPDLDLLDQERLIVTFPIDSGLPPILVVFKSPRYEPGVATGLGATVEGIWLAEETRGTGAEIPSQVADAIRGKEFRDFDAFRGELWKVIANTPELSKQFNPTNNKLMSRGYAPKARIADHHKGHATFILHHVTPISQGGAVYDIENIRVVTPKAHNKIHYGTSQ